MHDNAQCTSMLEPLDRLPGHGLMVHHGGLKLFFACDGRGKLDGILGTISFVPSFCDPRGCSIPKFQGCTHWIVACHIGGPRGPVRRPSHETGFGAMLRSAWIDLPCQGAIVHIMEYSNTVEGFIEEVRLASQHGSTEFLMFHQSQVPPTDAYLQLIRALHRLGALGSWFRLRELCRAHVCIRVI